MGTFTTKVKLSNMSDTSRSAELEAMVDTGSSYSWVSRARLQEIGVEPVRKGRFRTITGGDIERALAPVLVSFNGSVGGDTVVVAEAGDMEVIGAHTLQALGVAADTVQHKLVPTIGWALTAVALTGGLIGDGQGR